MAEQYREVRHRQEKLSKVTGIVFTVAAHLLLIAVGFFSGLKYIYPPPPEQSILIDFTESEVVKPVQVRTGTQPRAVNADPTKDIKLVQASEARHEGTKLNEAPEAKVDDFGDVETPEPVRKKKIDRRALFSAADNKTNKDTLAAQTAAKVSDALKAGHAQGNTKTGDTSGEPNAKLAGRSVLGALPKPSFTVQASGIVVVKIKVDQYGKVLEATPGDKGTNVTDKTLWEAARKAAMESRFNTSADAPAVQEGTITYIFNLIK